MSKSFLYRLKSQKWIRIFVYPFINLIRYSRLISYRFTSDSKKMKSLKDTHLGERCFVIGNGPSLSAKDLEKIKGEYCFAANRIFHIFDKTNWRPSAYMCVDSYVLRDVKDAIQELDTTNIFVQLEGKKYRIKNPRNNIVYINNFCPYLVNRYKRVNVKFSSDVSKWFDVGETVVYTAIQLAVYMGFREIYLLGVDHSYSKRMDSKGRLYVDNTVKDYFGNLPTHDYSIQNYETSTNAFKEARRYCESHGITIANLTPGGKLEVLKRDTLDNVLQKNTV